ncbi:SH3 domain-containing protein [Desulfopila aestuarii]|uniref:SH3-like domain-containing protein n=1 Tax=Desulfopila aestuarii DSM 18488 TaxID=1121416 RepID=A0A1M7Y179_9BACT|nr:SH3 domain-containing protein [Desulfopila aestuarii]SHO45332.1 SH3-like domain-containing protein [Desulfopila aestuarii DSM 18488]
MHVQNILRSGARSLLALSATCLLLATPAMAEEYVSVTKDNVNVRTAPNTQSQVYMELFAGYPLKVLKKDGEWLQISDFEGDTGWIHQSLVGKNNTVIINASKSVNMRAEPNTNSAVVADVERGVIMTKLEENGKWVKLKHSSGTIGWIYKPLLWP